MLFAAIFKLHVGFHEGDAAKPLKNNGEPCWIRTSDLLIKSQLLYRLS